MASTTTPALIISNHLIRPLAKLYAMYSDMYKDEYNFRPLESDWDFFASQVRGRDLLWQHMIAKWGEEKVRCYALGYNL